MPTLIRISGFEFVVFPNDHRPAHIHVFRGDDAVVIDVSGRVPVVLRIEGMKPNDVRRALSFATAYFDLLRRGWVRIHGPKLR